MASKFKKQWCERGVGTKITLGLLTIAILVVFVGGLGIWSSYRIAAISHKIGSYCAPALLSAEEMKSQTLRLQRELLSYTLLHSNAPYSNKTVQEMSHIVENYHDAKDAFWVALETYYSLDTSKNYPDTASRAMVEKTFEDYWNFANRLINEEQIQDLGVFERRLNQAESSLLDHIDAIIQHEAGHIIAAQRTLKSLTSKLLLLNIGVIAASLLLALGIAYHTSRTIIDPILDLKAAAVRLGRGIFLSEDKPLAAKDSQDEIGVLARAFTTMSDNLQQLNSDLYHNANHDVLTGLANRKYLLEALEAHLQSVQAQPQTSALLFLDFDRFKMINDYYGHQIGDKLLAAISLRLQESFRTQDLIARLGGDEFTVLLKSSENPLEVEKMAARLLQRLRRPFQVEALELRITASVGIVFINDGTLSAADILRDADIAMYQAKAKGAGCYEIFTESLRQATFSQMELEADLRQALKEGSLDVHYQPVVALKDQGALDTRALGTQTLGTEALVRWHHPERGTIYPDAFIPLAEETDLIAELDRFVLREACAQTVRWNKKLGTTLNVGVNISGQQFASQTLVQDVRDILFETGLEPERLQLELTETVLMDQTDLTLKSLKALKALGVTLHMDDFGTGYSSLAYLQHFDVDTLKIDRSFINAMLESEESATLVHTILVMAQSLNLEVIAEGVETWEQAAHLRSLGCELAQGFLFSKPKSAQDLESYFLETLTLADTYTQAIPGGLESNL